MPTRSTVKQDASKLVARVSLNASQKANVFISSRMSYSLDGEELRTIRAQLKALLQQAWPFMNVELAEDWTAGRKGSARELSIEGARWGDLLIAIFVADPGFRDDAGLFATEVELTTALEDSWDKIIFFAHEGLISSLQTQPVQYRELIERVMAYRDGKNVSIFENTNDLYQYVFNAVAGHVAATMRRYPARTSGKSTERVRWELMTFTERHAAIQEAFKGVAADVKSVGAVRALSDAEPRQGHVFYRMTVQADRVKRIVVPVIVSACPDRFSFVEAARFVGYPFRTMTEDWDDALGPLHIVCVYRSTTDSQIRRHLGNPDIRVAKEPWGYFARDPERSIQSLYLNRCEDATLLRERLHDALEWLSSTELTHFLNTAEARGRILAATSSRPTKAGGNKGNGKK